MECQCNCEECGEQLELAVYRPLLQYVKEPLPNAGYFNFEKLAKVVTGELKDKQGNVVDPGAYLKSTVNLFKTACVVAFRLGDKIFVGYAQWHQELDDYDPNEMLNIALERAVTLADNDRFPRNIPFKVRKLLPKFIQRATAFYKEAELVSWAETFLADPEGYFNERV